MKTLVPIDSTGRFVLPQQLVDQLDRSQGDFMEVELFGDHLEIRPLKNKRGCLSREGKRLVWDSSGEAIDFTDVQNCLGAIREERDDQITKVL